MEILCLVPNQEEIINFQENLKDIKDIKLSFKIIKENLDLREITKNPKKLYTIYNKPLIIILTNSNLKKLIYIFQHDYFIYEDNIYLKINKFLNKRQVARGITFIDNKVLLLKRIRKDGNNLLKYYAIPGGKIENLETIEDACLREIKEETSIKASINTYLTFEEYETGVCYYFLTNYISGTPCLGGEEKLKNSPDNSYEVKLVDLLELNKIMIYGIGTDLIKKTYKRYI